MKFIACKGELHNRLAALALVAAAHALIIYALAAGLPRFSSRGHEPPIEIKIIGSPAVPPAPAAAVAAAVTPRARPAPQKPTQPPAPPSPAALIAPQSAQPEQPSNPAASPAATDRSSAAAHAGRATEMAAAPAPPRAPVRVPAIALAKDCATPEYPRKSYRYNEEGTVTLALLIETDGHVAAARVEKSSGFKELDNAALAALSLCKFKPGTVDGKPEQSWAILRYQWKLE